MKQQKQYCKQCLVKLEVSGNCPECGNYFDLTKPDSSISSQHVLRNYYLYGLMASVLVGFTMCIVWFFSFLQATIQ